jgi:hypothetical protein
MHRNPLQHRLVALGASLTILAAVPTAAQASSNHAMKHPAMKKHHHAMKHKAMKHPSMKG